MVRNRLKKPDVDATGHPCRSVIQVRQCFEPLKSVDLWLQQYRVFWQANLKSLKAFVEAEYAKEQEQEALKSRPAKPGATKGKRS